MTAKPAAAAADILTAAPFAAEIEALEAERARLSLYPKTAAARAQGLTRKIDALKTRAAEYAAAQALAPVYAAAVKKMVGGSAYEVKAGAAALSDLDDQAAGLVTLSEWDSLTDAALAAL